MKEYGYDSQQKSENHLTPIEKLERKALDKDILDAIILDSRSFGDFNKHGMSKVLNRVANGYKPRNRLYNSKRLKHTFKDQREKIKKIFATIFSTIFATSLLKSMISTNYAAFQLLKKIIHFKVYLLKKKSPNTSHRKANTRTLLITG